MDDTSISHSSKHEQNDELIESQPPVDIYSDTRKGEQKQGDQPQPQQDQQPPPQPWDAPQPFQEKQAQFYPQQGNRPMYQTQQPAGHVQFVFQNGPNGPTQSPKSQPVPVHNVPLAQPVHYHHQVAYPSGAYQPGTAYPQGTQTRSIHPPPGPAQNMGPQAGASPHLPPGYPSPFTVPPDNGGVPPAGFGAASGFPVQNPGQVPVVVFQKPVPTEGWKTGLFDCMDDPNNAIITACCPCITFGQIAEIINNGNTTCSTSGILYGAVAFFVAMPCLISCSYRTKLRSKYGLVETPASDWITHFFCEWCALCQEYRELQKRGLDPSIGYQGNVARMQAGLQPGNMMPPDHQRMMA